MLVLLDIFIRIYYFVSEKRQRKGNKKRYLCGEKLKISVLNFLKSSNIPKSVG